MSLKFYIEGISANFGLMVTLCVLPIFEQLSRKIFARAVSYSATSVVPPVILHTCFIASCYCCPPSTRHLATLASCVFWKCGVVQLQLNWYHLSAGEICSRNFSPGFFSAEVWQHNAHRPSSTKHRGTEWPSIWKIVIVIRCWCHFISSAY